MIYECWLEVPKENSLKSINQVLQWLAFVLTEIKVIKNVLTYNKEKGKIEIKTEQIIFKNI